MGAYPQFDPDALLKMIPARPAIAAPQPQQPNLAITLPPGQPHNELEGGIKPLPSMASPASTAPAPKGTLEGDKAARQQSLMAGPGVSSIAHKIEGTQFGQNHPLLGKLAGWGLQIPATIADIVGESASPIIRNALSNVPGTFAHQAATLSGENRRIGEEEKEGQQEAQTGATQAEIPLRQAETTKAQTEAAALPGQEAEKQKLEDAQIQNLLHPQAKTAFEDWRKTNPDAPTSDFFKAEQAAKPEKDAGLPQQYMDALAKGDTQTAQRIKQTIHDTSTQPKIDVHAGEGGEAGTWSLQEDKDGNPVLFNAKTGQTKAPPAGLEKSGTFAKNAKPTADEQRRADLAENLNENLGTLRDIVTRRPELFGPLAGRWAELKQKFGSDDPDLATLQTIEHQIGMAQISAHGMRSAQGIQAAGDSILNHLHSGPHGVIAAIDAAQNSVKTFSGDVENKGKPKGGGQNSGPAVGAIENGYRFKGGDPKSQSSWEKVK